MTVKIFPFNSMHFQQFRPRRRDAT